LGVVVMSPGELASAAVASAKIGRLMVGAPPLDAPAVITDKTRRNGWFRCRGVSA
jgi:hypothetical protein